MVLKFTRSIWIVSFIVILLVALIPENSAHAASANQHLGELPLLNDFVSRVQNGQVGELRGIYIPDVLAALVVQQAAGDHEFVSPRQNVLTQFNLASQWGSTGLLAHNYLAGERFSLLERGQHFYLIYGDGQISTFVIVETISYQALEPASTSSGFLSLENDSFLPSSGLFSQIYNRPGSVIFQTCISRNNDLNWGRLFVIAEPAFLKP